MQEQATEISRKRISKWMMQAKSISPNSTWTEKRLVIQLGDSTFLLEEGQVFVCPHCGHYDPEWTTTEVIQHFKDLFDNVKVKEIQVDVNWKTND